MRFLLAALFLVTNAPHVLAERALSAEEFDALTLGRTFYYGNQSGPYGAEEYLSGRRVIWSFLDGKCQYGSWYPDGDQICFVYERIADPQCWSFHPRPEGLIAYFRGDPQQIELGEVAKSDNPLICPGPEIGV